MCKSNSGGTMPQGGGGGGKNIINKRFEAELSLPHIQGGGIFHILCIVVTCAYLSESVCSIILYKTSLCVCTLMGKIGYKSENVSLCVCMCTRRGLFSL